MDFFTISISASSPTCQSAPASIPSVWPPPPHPVPLPPMPTKLWWWIHHPLPSSVLPRPGLTAPSNSSTGAMPGWEAPSGEQSLGIPHMWQGVSTWQCGRRTPFCPPKECSFTAARVQLSEGWLPPCSRQELKDEAKLLVPFCTLGSTAASSKLQAPDRQSILLTRSNFITWNND